MNDYERVETTCEVYHAILNQHIELKVFKSHSFEGDMFTSWGFRNSGCPLIEARTTWDTDTSKPYGRMNERHTYWLCYPKENEEVDNE